MKKLILIVTCFGLILLSCHKAVVVTPEYNGISATINGKYQTFNALDSVRVAGTTGLYVTGSNDTTSDKIMLFFANVSGNPIAPGTYTTTTAGGNTLQMLYGVGPGYTFDNYYYTYHITDGPAYDATLTVTAVDSTSIKGTFSGTVVLESSILDTGARPTKTITNGKFNLKIK
ncbi:MAG TPA: hypothetical protein VFE54_06925 [Mucilaginibacter sp.]|jgi:hypothetical protein|nr:hypothetical protein [Mucilaginibacter sp.]